ncbi:MAG TPA: FAD-binding protein [Steroidobacteraceae bacterium]|nr:FAD-binding protein [Steroidobacteraceae bacterium]
MRRNLCAGTVRNYLTEAVGKLGAPDLPGRRGVAHGGGMVQEGSAYDLVVLGCGAAGLSAAVAHAAAARAADRTARIAVVERARRDERGGATRWTSAWLRITEDRRLDPAFLARMHEVSGGLADLEYCRTLEREVTETLAFLERHGVELTYFKQPFANRNTGSGLGMPVRGGQGIVEELCGSLERTAGVEMLYETEAVRLTVSERGRIAGVTVRSRDGAARTLTAAAGVVIACGGFEGNGEMLTRYLGARACDLPLIAPTLRHNTGDGVRMALEVGAATSGQFDMFHGEPVDPRSSKPDAVVYAYPFGILVNARAERFYDEGKDSFDSTFEELAFEIWAHQGQRAYLIGDQTMASIEPVQAIILTDQPPVTAATLRELAVALGLEPRALERTVSEYNAAVGPGAFDPRTFDGKRALGLAPPRSNWAVPVERPPFIGYPLTCAITFTFGGLRTDTLARVVTPSGAAIPGLYAAGEVTGLYYHHYPAGTSVLRAATFGRIAGAHAARVRAR